MQESRKQSYRYQAKTVSVKDSGLSWAAVPFNDKIRLLVAVPDDVVDLVGLFTKVIVDGGSAAVTGGSIVAIGPSDEMVSVDAPFVDNQASVALDFSYMIDKFKINNGLIGTVTQPYIQIDMQIAGSTAGVDDYGKVKLWKADMIYTTLGTR